MWSPYLLESILETPKYWELLLGVERPLGEVPSCQETWKEKGLHGWQAWACSTWDVKGSPFLERQTKDVEVPGSCSFNRGLSFGVCHLFSWQLCHRMSLGSYLLLMHFFKSAVPPDESERGHGPSVHKEHQRQFPLRGLRSSEWVCRVSSENWPPLLGQD